MTETKKRFNLTHFLFVVLICVLIGVLYISVKDFTLTQAEQFEIAQKAERTGELKKAERYYLMANDGSNQNVARLSSYYLGRIYRVGGEGFAVNGQRAEMFLEQAALKNVPQAQYELALMYDVGDKIPENRERALRWMNLAAQQGFADALYSLGVWVERGYMGTPDMSKVIALYEQAAIQDHIYAMTSLIALYSGGFNGIERDADKVTFWLNRLTELKTKK